jgi:hypothetical protein
MYLPRRQGLFLSSYLRPQVSDRGSGWSSLCFTRLLLHRGHVFILTSSASALRSRLKPGLCIHLCAQKVRGSRQATLSCTVPLPVPFSRESSTVGSTRFQNPSSITCHLHVLLILFAVYFCSGLAHRRFNGFTELGDVEWRRYGNICGWEESLSLLGIGIGGLKAVVLQMNGKRNSSFCLISLSDLLWFDS